MMALISAGVYVGLVIGIGILPILFTLAFSNIHAFSEIPINSIGLASAPQWLDQDGGVFTSHRVDAAGLVITLFVVRYFGILGDRLWRFLAVKKFNWMTTKELEEFDKHQTRFDG